MSRADGSREKVVVSRVLHAGYVFACGETRIVFDPILKTPFSANCHAYPPVRFDHAEIRRLKFDAVFISHFHEDHCCFESLDLLDRATPVYLYCLHEELFTMLRRLGFATVHALELNSAVRVGEFEVTPRRALDPDVDSVFQIQAGGLNLLNVVDAWLDLSTLDLLRNFKWDMVLWPFQTMREIDVLSPSRAPAPSRELPHEWVEQLQALAPRFVVPSSCQFVQESWSWYNHFLFPISYRRFESEMATALPQAQVIRMNPSESVVLSRDSLCPAEPVGWVSPEGEQNLDYEIDENLVPPSTSEIARRFATLSTEAMDRVEDYCRHELPERFRSLGPPADVYFNRPRIWRLALYDHTGAARDFFYQLYGEEMELIPEGAAPVEWLTEVPVARLYGAIAEGESLTSMYMRINDGPFAPSMEAALQNADVMEDPLIRCLFNGAFGGYHEAQLRRAARR
jgi:hypothetical protein